MSRHEGLLLAGALLRSGDETGAEAPLEPLRARRYRHPALGARTVVRLAGETAAPGEDSALAFLGFEPPEATQPLARALRRGLGFPQWVLVNDPEHAGEALAVVEDMARAAHLARSRPGAAKDRYQELARRLPQRHLPSFWEQAGRAFIAAGHLRYAAIAFEKAREAERVYAFPVNEATRREVFLEFAFAGALTARSLAGYAAELRHRHPAEQAYEAFRELALRRTLGGLPPWTDLPEQVRRLAGEAGRDQAAAAEQVLGDLLALPATRLAPAGFWRRSRSTLVAMGRASAALRGTLLNLFPTPGGAGDAGFAGWWLELLEEASALDALVRPAGEVPAEAAPARGAADWLARFLEHPWRGRWWHDPHPPARLYPLLARMAPRLRADRRPVVLPSSRWRRTLDVNVADACLAHGIPLADPPQDATIDLQEWLRSQADGGVRRPLAHAAADPRFRPLLAAAVPAWSSQAQRPADALLVSEPLEQVVRWWFEQQAAAVGEGGLVQAARRLQELARSSGPQTLARFPSAHATLAATSLVAPLARTLRAGLLDELGWPALEEAAAELEPLAWSASWPVLVLWNSRKAVAVGPTGRVAEHSLRIPPGNDRAPTVLYAGGQFLVCWIEQGRQLAYWSAAPEDRFPAGNVAAWWQEHNCPCGFAFLLPDGGRVAGGRALYPGDRTLPVGSAHLLWDGHTFWAVDQEGDHSVLRELDPRTGGHGRQSLPSFLEDHAAPGGTLLGELCSLAPLPGGLAGTPLGQRGGLAGFRVATAATGGRPAVWVEGVDGRRLQAPTAARGPVALVALPGAARPRLLSGGGELELWDPDLPGPLAEVAVGHAGSKRRAFSGRLPAEGTPFGPPPAFWHCLVARDERGSRALRGLGDEAAGELLAAALLDLKGRLAPPPEAMGRTAAAVERLLPEVSSERLLRGLLGTVRRAAELERRRGDLTGARATAGRPTPGPGASSAPGWRWPAPPDAPLDEEALAEAITGWDGGRASYQVRHMVATPVAGQLQLLGRFFAGQVEADALTPALWAPAFPWPQLLGRVGALAFLAVSPLLGERSRAALLALLELWAEQPFAVDPGSFRVGYLEGAAKTAGRSPHGAYVVLADSPSWMLPGGRHRAGTFLERPTGTATALPPEANVAETRRVEAGWGTPAQLAAFARLVRERGPLPWDPAVPEALAARTGLTRAEATLLWAGLPYLDTWGSDFLGPEPRRLLGLTLAEAKTARDALRRVGDERRFGLLHAAMPDDPARLWTPLGNGPDDESSPVGRLAAAWVGRFGRRVRPPEDAVVEAAALDRPTPASELLATLLEPVAVPALVRDRDCWIAAGRHGEVALAAGDGMAEAMTRLVGDLAAAIPWAFAARPVGDPLRARLPELLALVRDRLRHPGLLLAAAHCYVEDPGQLVRRLFGSAPYKGRNGAGFPGQSADDGLTIAVVVSGWSLELFFRPALLGDDARSQVLRAQLEQPGWPAGSVAAVDLLHSEGYAAMAGRVRTTPVPEGAFEANPALSAPEVVTAARDTLGLSEDAAVLYLQLLALLEPTDRNLRRWNGWTPARHRRAAAELLRTSLVVEARRERARRPLFVPGEWVPAAAPNLPLEAWKLPLYCLTRHPSDGRPRSPIGRFLPLTPLHQIFAAAWGRLQGGDRPGGAG